MSTKKSKLVVKGLREILGAQTRTSDHPSGLILHGVGTETSRVFSAGLQCSRLACRYPYTVDLVLQEATANSKKPNPLQDDSDVSLKVIRAACFASGSRVLGSSVLAYAESWRSA